MMIAFGRVYVVTLDQVSHVRGGGEKGKRGAEILLARAFRREPVPPQTSLGSSKVGI